MYAQAPPTPRDPMDSSLPGSSVLGFSREEHWSGLPLLSPGDVPNSRIDPWCLMSNLHWQAVLYH